MEDLTPATLDAIEKTATRSRPVAEPTELERVLAECDTFVDLAKHKNAPVPALLADAARILREMAAYIAEPEPVHTYKCSYWRRGSNEGPCECGALEKDNRRDAARAKWRLS